MILSGRTIRTLNECDGLYHYGCNIDYGHGLKIDPVKSWAYQPASVDVHLKGPIKVWTGPVMLPSDRFAQDNAIWWETLQPTVDDEWRGAAASEGKLDAWFLQPGRIYLAALEEWIRVPLDLVGFLTGVSTRAREGIVVHQQAGLLDPRWEGNATCEITVAAENTVVFEGQRIGQVYFQRLDVKLDESEGYNGRYQGDRLVSAGRIAQGATTAPAPAAKPDRKPKDDRTRAERAFDKARQRVNEKGAEGKS